MEQRASRREDDSPPDEVITVVLGTTTLESVASSSDLNLEDATRDRIRHALVVFVPIVHFGDYEHPVFAECTADLFQYIRARVGNDMETEIAIEDPDYQEISLRSDAISIPEMIMTLGVAPVIVNLVSQWIITRFSSRKSPPAVTWTATIQTANESRTLSYSGPADTFERLVLDSIETIRRNDHNDTTA